MEKNMRRCEVCGKVYDECKSRGFINLDSDRPDNENKCRKYMRDCVQYKVCVECHDKLLKVIEDMVHGGM